MKTNIKIYHNPRCGTSRNVKAYLDESGVEYEIKLYLTDPPSISELKSLLKKLDKSPLEIIRKKEKIFIENFENQEFSDDKWIQVITQNPKLLERPIVETDKRAQIGRPKEAAYRFIDSLTM